MPHKYQPRRSLFAAIVWLAFTVLIPQNQGHAGWLRCRLARSSVQSCCSPVRLCPPVCCRHAHHHRGQFHEVRVIDSAATDRQSNAATDITSNGKPPGESIPVNKSAAKKEVWKSLFDGKTLDGWAATEFGGEGDVYVEDGSIILGFGSPLTGVTYKGSHPKTNYEIRLDAMRMEGSDFFCGLTFRSRIHTAALSLEGGEVE